MSESERRAYDMGREAGRREAAPVLLPPDADATGRRVRIPKLSLSNVHRYIEAVSKALERSQITAPEARAMLYAAQMLIASYKALASAMPESEPETRIGFIQAAAEQLEAFMKPYDHNNPPKTGPTNPRPPMPKVLKKPADGGSRSIPKRKGR